jgi:hypothetical protein
MVTVLGAVRGVQGGPAALRQPQRLARLTVEERFKVLRAEFDGPQVRREAGGEVEGKRRPVGAGGRQGGVHGAAGVDDEHVAGLEEFGEVPEARVDYPVVCPVGDHEANLVAGEAPGLRRFVRLKIGRQLEVEALGPRGSCAFGKRLRAVFQVARKYGRGSAEFRLRV